ncbi:hypothetical protein PMI07_002060 [Rhizobium sp. CF080]|uniref:hypothetical protein n=1 Tax=Rhizobium sp. (strain CF080) TaxID=1144310 RepID=UPI000271CE08|nr:hypothetical protein [Rhizobium sp. CF080]EUB95572.1 hypothetical protein PMI07_002060 [Rhizobium sp. CF080]
MKVTGLAFALLLVPCATWASTKELDAAVTTATHYGMAPMPRPDRQALSKAGLAYWKSFESRIPRNSPAVTEWLIKELSTTDRARIARALSTPEYALRSLSETAENCAALFGHLVENPAAPALTELYLWTKTLGCYKSPDDLLIYLKQAGLSNGQDDGAFSLQHFGLFHQTITGHLANAIIDEGQKAK